MDETRKPTPEAFPCAPFEAQLDALLAAEADESTQRRWGRHLEECQPCAMGWALVRGTLEDLRGLPAEARADVLWPRLEAAMTASPHADELDPAMSGWMRTWRELPLTANAADGWRRLEGRLDRRPEPAARRWPVGLVAASVALPSALLAFNEVALAGLRATAPAFLAGWLEPLTTSAWSPLLLLLAFVGFGGVAALASIPLLRRAMLEPHRGGAPA